MIPVLDWSCFISGKKRDEFARHLGKACRESGFFLLSGHGVPRLLIDDTFAAAKRFFDLPEREKIPLDIRTNSHNRGWTAYGSENLDDSRPDQVDRKEAFNIGLELADDDPRMDQPFRGPNLWPDLPGFRETALAYYDAVLRLGIDLHRAIALDLGLKENHFTPFLDEPLATLRLLHYPGDAGKTGGIGAGAHTDYGSITLLTSDGEPGLQVMNRAGTWIDVPTIPDTFVVNIADCLMRWTNDIYFSAPHRVLVTRNPRFSLAFFLDPNPNAVIEALPGTGNPRYQPVTSAEYLKLRLDATYGAKITE
ncbi:MAG: isopenicillin N synthase family oxygenase [Boseongicola sp.]|nr:isopenicillin N synthase family oxygenase [Boseongicola sp.]